MKQIHGTKVINVKDALNTAPPPEADGLVTNRPNLALSVLSADCLPVLFAEPKARVIGAAHAGWRGLQSGILDATIRALCAIGANKSEIRAVIGPAISASAFEVGPELRAAFLEADPTDMRFFMPANKDRFYFDLPACAAEKLNKAGIKDVNWTGHCTYQNPGLFFSHRYATHQNKGETGRQIAAIML